jgi:hypothetical protein
MKLITILCTKNVVYALNNLLYLKYKMHLFGIVSNLEKWESNKVPCPTRIFWFKDFVQRIWTDFNKCFQEVRILVELNVCYEQTLELDCAKNNIIFGVVFNKENSNK